MLASARKAQEIYTELDQLNTYHHEVDTKLRRLRSDVNLSGIFVRDYLLDVERERAPEYRQQLSDFRSSTLATLNELRTLAGGDAEPDRQPADAPGGLLGRPLTRSSIGRRPRRSSGVRGFLRLEVVPRREAVLAIAQEIEELNNANLDAQRAEVARRHAAFNTDLHRLIWQSVLLGLAVALGAVFRLRVLERRSDEQRERAQESERQMRQLSQQLVAAQEEERKHLSRELHDHVAQVLTALRMELGRIERTRPPGDTPVGAAVAESKTPRRRPVPHRARPRAWAETEHAGRFRSPGCPGVACARLHRALRLERPARYHRKPGPDPGRAPALCLSGSPGGLDELHPPRARDVGPRQRRRTAGRRSARRDGDRRRSRTDGGAARPRPWAPGHRRTREGTRTARWRSKPRPAVARA